MRTIDDLTRAEGQRLLAALDAFIAMEGRHRAAMQAAAACLATDPDALARFRGLDDQLVAAQRDLDAVVAALGLTSPWAGTEREESI